LLESLHRCSLPKGRASFWPLTPSSPHSWESPSWEKTNPDSALSSWIRSAPSQRSNPTEQSGEWKTAVKVLYSIDPFRVACGIEAGSHLFAILEGDKTCRKKFLEHYELIDVIVCLAYDICAADNILRRRASGEFNIKLIDLEPLLACS